LANSGSARCPAAAVVGQKADECVHVFKVGAVKNEATVLAALSESGAGKARKVKRQRGRWEIELFADDACRHPFWARLDEQAKDREPGFLR
jgi:hypothetical protein